MTLILGYYSGIAINCIDGVFQDVRRQEQYYLVDCNHAESLFSVLPFL